MKELKFSQNLDDLLKANQMSQQTLANILNTSQATVNRWVKGINQPSYENLILISILFNETTDFLLGKEDLNETQIDEIRKSLLSNTKNN